MAAALLIWTSPLKMVIVGRLLAGILVAAALAWPTASYARQQPPKSLGEIAREEAERRKALTTPTKVYTKEDLPRSAQLPLTPPGTAAAAEDKDKVEKGEQAETAGKAGKDKDKDEDEKVEKDEAWWRNRVSETREALRRGEMFAQALQTRINSLAADFAARDDPMQRAQIAVDRNKAIAELDLTSKEIKSLRQRLADIEEEARRSGVPAGWLR